MWPMFALMDRLVHIDTKANLVPGLAVEWKYTDEKTVRNKSLSQGHLQVGAA